MAMTENLRINTLFQELIENQRKKIFQMAKKIAPQITEEDLLQPQDFFELDQNPNFRHEEGLLEGLYTAYHAILSLSSK